MRDVLRTDPKPKSHHVFRVSEREHAQDYSASGAAWDVCLVLFGCHRQQPRLQSEHVSTLHESHCNTPERECSTRNH